MFIKEVFGQFLSEQKSKLAPKTYRDYASVMDLYDHMHSEENVGEFLDYFVSRKVMAGDDFILKTCPRVMRKLLKWMREKHLVDLTNEDIQAMCENQLWEDTMRD